MELVIMEKPSIYFVVLYLGLLEKNLKYGRGGIPKKGLPCEDGSLGPSV